MGKLTTHVLDTMNGCPAAGMRVRVFALAGGGETRCSANQAQPRRPRRRTAPRRRGAAPGTYRLVFDVAAYFRGRGVTPAEPPFLDTVPLDFGIADPALHYHVPLLASPLGLLHLPRQLRADPAVPDRCACPSVPGRRGEPSGVAWMGWAAQGFHHRRPAIKVYTV